MYRAVAGDSVTVSQRVNDSASQRSAESLNRSFVFAGSLIRRIAPWLAPALFLGVFFFYPLARILWLGLNPASLSGLGANDASRTFYVLLFTFYQAFLSTLLTLLVGLPAAYLFARFDFYGRPLLRLLTAIPFMLPTVVVVVVVVEVVVASRPSPAPLWANTPTPKSLPPKTPVP